MRRMQHQIIVPRQQQRCNKLNELIDRSKGSLHCSTGSYIIPGNTSFFSSSSSSSNAPCTVNSSRCLTAAAVDCRVQTLRSIREHCDTLAFNVVNGRK
eukprot:7258-Heterococcus_DN1.PRE.1